MTNNKKRLCFLIVIVLVSFSCVSLAAINDRIVLDNPDLVEFSTTQSYDLISVDLRLPENSLDNLSADSRDKLLNLIELYGDRSSLQIDKDLLLTSPTMSELDGYSLNVDDNEKSLSINPMPGMSLNAGFNKDEEDNSVKQNTNIGLQYWMNNRTLLHAEYGMENKEWWDIKGIKLNDPGNQEKSSRDSNNEIVYNEEKNETGRLGISYQTNDKVTISADYVDSTSPENDFSTIFGVEYRDEVGILRYHYQIDFGNQKIKETGLEFGYKDLATFNATYKMFDPKLIDDQLEQYTWDIGLDVNLNDISTLSLGYQVKPGDHPEEGNNVNEDESNINAQLKIKF